MNKEKDISISLYIIFVGLLQIAFIVLKLCKVISWSWVWVLSIIWVPIATIVSLGVFAIIVAILGCFIKGDGDE